MAGLTHPYMTDHISDEEADSFIEAWNKSFNQILTRDQARDEAERLLNFFRLICRPLPKGFTPPSAPPPDPQPSAEFV
jgi:hypothetical protein